jgi:hypothetical protein
VVDAVNGKAEGGVKGEAGHDGRCGGGRRAVEDGDGLRWRATAAVAHSGGRR